MYILYGGCPSYRPMYQQSTLTHLKHMGGDQHLERPNVERPIFPNFKISNIKTTKKERVFYVRFFVFLFIEIIQALKIYDNSPKWTFLEF